ncbi:MAG: hypothetical protein ABI824_17045 [Acidobacteriota bacterium]
MISWNKIAVLGAVLTGIAAGQPALTTIQDVLYRADGTRFTGTMFIAYDSFQSGDTSNIATANLTVPIVNGSLRVRLVPTTTATAGAQYQITYNSAGINQFTETWSVPATSATLRVRDVRTSNASVVGPAPIISPVQIGDVLGLANELDIRPMRGVGFSLGRAAVINSAGQLDAAAGNLSDCIRVDGTSGACGSGGGGFSGLFADGEVPWGTVNGINQSFLLLHPPSPAASLQVVRNGLVLRSNSDYQLSGNTLTFYIASVPQPGDIIQANYRYGDPSNPLGSFTASQVICSGVGAATSATSLTQLGSCTIPSGTLATGDRLEIRYQFAHTGTLTGFASQVRIGGTTVASVTAPSSEPILVGQTDFGLYSGAQSWDTRTWGTTLTFQSTAGSASEDITQALTISFRGQLSGSAADTVALRNFTVIRYPAQLNP